MKRFAYIIFLSSSLSLSSQNIYKLSVDELLEKGIENSIVIQVSIVKAKISEKKEHLAQNKQLPDITFGGVFGYVGTPVMLDRDLSFKSHPNTPDWKQNYQISATQPIYQGGRIKYGIERANLESEIARLAVKKDKSDLKLWLIGKYLELFNLYKKKDVYFQNIEEATIRVNDIEHMKEQGMITTNDVLRSKLTLTNYKLLYQETQNNIELISQQLTIVLGMDESIVIEPDYAFLNTRPILKSELTYISEAYNQSPDLQITGSNIRLAENNLKLTKSDILPSLSLQASNTLARPIPNISPAQDFYLNAWGITLNLSYRISSWFDRKHNVNLAKQQIQLQELAKEEEKQTIRTNTKMAFVRHKEACDRLQALEESLKQAKENYRIVKNKYFNQLSILTDLLDANTVELDTELQLTEAQTNAIYTYYQLQRISGNL